MGAVLRNVHRHCGLGSLLSHTRLDGLPTHDRARGAAASRRRLKELRRALPEDSGSQLRNTVGQPLPLLYAASFLAALASAAASCENCVEGDHTSNECALAPVTALLPKRAGFH